MKRFDRNVMFLGVLAFVLVAAMLVLAFAMSSPVEAGGGGGQCRPQFWYLNGCEHRVRCDIGRPVFPLTPDEDGWFNGFCYHDPQAPEAGGNLQPGQRLKFECPTPIYTIPVGEYIVIVGCHD